MTINDDDIAYAASILLHSGQNFDEERRTFIKNLETIDLQAVPGSGKTTALLAKLVILEKHLPFEDGSGILVLSHTNAAIDEIDHRIGTHCPKLFAYPNFVGTIQSFVDRFLALPYYRLKYGKRPYRIDYDAYQDAHRIPAEAQAWLSRRRDKDRIVYGSRLLSPSVLGYDIMADGSDFPLRDQESLTYQALLRMKTDLRNDGNLCFDDAYVLAFEYIREHGQIRLWLRNRFRYVFVDEMQDMEAHQYELLEVLFYADNAWVYQRIGDKNQAIYSHEVMVDEIWAARDTELRLTGSQRLSPRIAQVVAPFATSYIDIDGRNTSDSDGRTNDISPCAIVYDDTSATDVIWKFCELIEAHRSEGKIPDHPPYPIKAIAWVKDERGLRRYWPQYQAEAARSKVTHSRLKDYVVFARQEDWEAAGLRPIHKKIIDGLLKVLHLEGVRNPSSRSGYFSMRSLLKHLRETNPTFYDTLRSKSFAWSRDVHAGKADDVCADVRNFVPLLLGAFEKRLAVASDFVFGEPAAIASDDTNGRGRPKVSDNICRCPATGIEVHVGTVHSAKGETHTATLYLESYYYNDRGKSYESQRLLDQFKGEPLSPGAGTRVKQSARMVYVGFSRPTHLLCFAVHKDRFDEATFREQGWEIERVC